MTFCTPSFNLRKTIQLLSTQSNRRGGNMSNEIEKMFFNTFGIKPLITTTSYEYYPNYKGKDIFNGFIYPEITDRILLEMIVILNPYVSPAGRTLKEMREQVMFCCIRFKSNIYKQIRTLFGYD